MMRHHPAPPRRAKISQSVPSADKDMFSYAKWNTRTLLMGGYAGTTTFKNYLAVSAKASHPHPTMLWYNNSTPGYINHRNVRNGASHNNQNLEPNVFQQWNG